MLNNLQIVINKDIRSGVPVLKDTRFPIHLIFSNLRNMSLDEIINDLSLTPESVYTLIEELAEFFNKSYTENRFDEFIEIVKCFQANSLSENDRREFWDRIQEGYCKYCGLKTDKVCHCMNDE